MEVSNSRKKFIVAAPTSALSPLPVEGELGLPAHSDLRVSEAGASSIDPSASLAEAELGGSQLIDTLVTLTGLPEPFAHQELDQILSLSGHQASDRADLTLDDLRQALITYLEALRPEEGFEESESSSPSVDCVSEPVSPLSRTFDA